MGVKKILVVDDEKKIVEAVKAYLEHDNYTVYTCADGVEAINFFDRIKPDLLILDLMLPKLGGEDVCQHIRKYSRVPIIMLTAKSAEGDKINGFDIGADDYVTKPFSPRELVMRVQSVLRRCSESSEPLYNVMTWNQGELTINFTSREVHCNGEIINLTPNEFKLLSTLANYPKKAFTREELINSALGIEYEGNLDIQFLTLLNRGFIIAAAGALAVSVLLGLFIAGRISGPIKKVIRKTKEIESGNYAALIEESSNTLEMEQLISSVNTLAVTLGKQKELRRRLAQDYAHEFRTPLAALQSNLEAMIDGIWEPESQAETLSGCCVDYSAPCCTVAGGSSCCN
ncbi:MAG: response regulator [Lachnospiraceae bacterium]